MAQENQRNKNFYEAKRCNIEGVITCLSLLIGKEIRIQELDLGHAVNQSRGKDHWIETEEIQEFNIDKPILLNMEKEIINL